MGYKSSALVAAIVGSLATPVWAQDTPISAIDWLSDSVRAPALQREQIIIAGPEIDTITTTSLDDVKMDGVGLIPAADIGLPSNTWGSSQSSDIAAAFAVLTGHGKTPLPAVQDFTLTLLLAELAPPVDSNRDAELFFGRIDALLALGAIDQAQALLERAGATTPAMFRRWFDVALLTGTENDACAALQTNAELSPSFPARIFCLARNGDWSAAALTLDTAKALNFVSDDQDALLARFLDPELFEGEPSPKVPSVPTPLEFRMFEAIGEPISINGLPRAYAHSDLRPQTGWKSQLEAAEILARAGTISTNRLLGIYSANTASASGGVWNRVRMVQALEAAIKTGDPTAVSAILPDTYAEFQSVDLLPALGSMFGADLAGIDGLLDPHAFRLMMMSLEYETIAQTLRPSTPFEIGLAAIARGEVPVVIANDDVSLAVATAFGSTDLGPYTADINDGRLGEAILTAMAALRPEGDMTDAAAALSFFRGIGLEEFARRAALQLMILRPSQA